MKKFKITIEMKVNNNRNESKNLHNASVTEKFLLHSAMISKIEECNKI